MEIKRRRGTIDRGSSYEQKLAAMLGTKCALDNNVDDMWIATNVDELEAFDDLVLFRQEKNGFSNSREIYLIQIKNKKQKQLRLSNEEMKKYQTSFLMIKNNFSNSQLKKYCEFKDIKFVIFANKKIVAPKITFSEYNNSNDFLNTGKMLKINKADCNYDPDFLNQTLFYSKQANLNKIEDIIKNNLNKHFINCNVEKIISFFEKWHFGFLKNKIKLRKEDIQYVILEVVLSEYIPEELKMITFTNADIWNEVTSQTQFMFLKEDHLSKIWHCIKLQMCDFFDDQDIDLLKWNEPLETPSNKINKIKECFDNIPLPINKDGSSYNIKDLYLILWQVCKIPLILNINGNSNAQTVIYEALTKLDSSNSTRKRYILIGQVTNNDLEQYCTSFNILSLDRDIQEKILKHSYLSLQGKQALTLKQLKLTTAALRNITPELLMKMLETIPKKVEDDAGYIHRYVEQPIVELDVLTISNVVFVILAGEGPINYDLFRRYGISAPWYIYQLSANKCINITDQNIVGLKNLILKKCTVNFKEIKQIEDIIGKVRKSEKEITVHYLRLVNKNKLEWIYSNRNANQMKPFFVKDSYPYLSDLQLYHYLTFNILSGNAGEGKSTILHFLANQCPSDVWVVKLNICEIAEYITKTDFSDIKTFLFHQSNENKNKFKEFFWKLFEKFYDEQNIFIIIDGVDEVEYNSNIKLFFSTIMSLRIKTVIVTRPSLRETLEQEFHSLALVLKPLTKKECNSLIKLTLRINNIELKEEHINKFLQNVSLWNNVVGVPLLLKLFASLLDYTSIIDISDLFDRYIKEQLKNNYNNFTITTLSKTALFVLYKEEAIIKLFSISDYMDHIEDKKEIYIKSKLIERYNKKNPVFAHKSLAEFLVAKYLYQFAEHTGNIFQKFLKSLFYKELETVRLFFDTMTLKDSKLQHIITTSNSIYSFDSNLVDKFGRNALHIAASYGNRCELRTSQLLWSGVIIYESYNSVCGNSVIFPCQKIEQRIVVPSSLVRHLLQKGLDPFKKDNLFKMDVFEFATESGSIEIIEELFKNNKYVKQLKNVNKDILLFYTVKHGCVNLFRRIENKNFNLKILPSLDNLLHIAICNERFEIIKELTTGIIPINESNNIGYSPLISWLSSLKLDNCNKYLLSMTKNNNFLEKNQLNILNHLIDKKVNLNMVNSAGEAPLHTFSGSKKKSKVELLIQNGAEVNKETHRKAIPLHYASQYSLDNVKLLLKYKSDLDVPDIEGYTPLCSAAENNKIDIVKYLIGQGADVNPSKTKAQNPLNIAVAKGYVDCAKLLLEKGAKITKGKENSTLGVAIYSGEVKCINLLLENGAKIDKWLFRLAISLSQQDILTSLLSKKENIITSISMKKLLFQSVHTDCTDIIKILLSNKVDINVIENDKGNLLHLACLLGFEKMVEYLSKYKSLVNKENKVGDTPLTLAVESNNLEVIKIIVKSGCDLQKYGSDALYEAVRNDYRDVFDYLESVGVKVNARNSKGRAPIHHAAENHLSCVKYLTRKGADINLKTVHEGYTPLMIAAGKGLLDIIEYLIQNGVEVNHEDNLKRCTALTLASQEGHLECVKLLIDRGSNLGKYGPKAMLVAANRGHTSIINYMIQANINVDGKPAECLLNKKADTDAINVTSVNEEQIIEVATPLESASMEGHLECVKFLIDKGSDVRKYGPSAIYLAATDGHITVVDYLISRGADINGIIYNNETPIHRAVIEGHLKAVKILLQQKADINKTLLEGYTPLMLAAFKGHKEIVKYLIENGARLDVKNANQCTALMLAAQEGHIECLDILISKDNDWPNCKYGPLTIYLSANKQLAAVVEFLISKGVDINGIIDDTAPIHEAILRSDLQVVKLLLKNGAKINSTTPNKKRTPLMLAACENRMDIVHYLIKNGAELDVEDDNKHTALILASAKGHVECLKILINERSDLRKYGPLAIYFAAIGEHTDAVDCLISEGANVNGIIANGYAPIHNAAFNGNLKVLKYLIEKGAMLDIESENGHVALIIASQEGHLDFVKFLVTEGCNVVKYGELAKNAATRNDHRDVAEYLTSYLPK